jgi:hypothetical protein
LILTKINIETKFHDGILPFIEMASCISIFFCTRRKKRKEKKGKCIKKRKTKNKIKWQKLPNLLNLLRGNRDIKAILSTEELMKKKLNFLSFKP